MSTCEGLSHILCLSITKVSNSLVNPNMILIPLCVAPYSKPLGSCAKYDNQTKCLCQEGVRDPVGKAKSKHGIVRRMAECAAASASEVPPSLSTPPPSQMGKIALSMNSHSRTSTSQTQDRSDIAIFNLS